jgi:hypothetical protein
MRVYVACSACSRCSAFHQLHAHSWISALARQVAGQGVRLLESGVCLALPRFRCVGAALSEAPIGGRTLQVVWAAPCRMVAHEHQPCGGLGTPPARALIRQRTHLLRQPASAPCTPCQLSWLGLSS